MSFLRVAKIRVFDAADALGVSAALASSEWRHQRLLVLCYHGVSLADEHEWDGALYVSASHLRQRFAMLRHEGYTVLSLEEGLRRVGDGTLPERSVALTFDDGTHDFAVQVHPLLLEFGYHATVYLTTYYCLHQYPVFNTACRYVLWKSGQEALSLVGILAKGDTLPIRTTRERELLFTELYAHGTALRMNAERWHELLLRIAERAGVSLTDIAARRILHVMSPHDIASLSTQHVAVELHTHRHRVPLDRDAFTREIQDNRRVIADLTNGRIARHFCYPSGVTHTRLLPWLRELEVETATTVAPGLASRYSNLLLVPRFVDTSSTTTAEYKSWLSGLGSLMPKRRVRTGALLAPEPRRLDA